MKFEKADYSYNYLCNEADTIVEEIICEKQIEVVSYCVSEKDNKIIINIEMNEVVQMQLKECVKLK